MKRSRDDGDYDGVLVDSEHKRPAISPRVQQPGQVLQMTNSVNAHKLTTDDALSYLKHVKEFFEAKNNNKYDDFLKIMKDFKAQRIDTDGVILSVKKLFKDNRDLILGFNRFLPRGHEINLSLEIEPITEKSQVTFEAAVDFVNKIKGRFNNNVYKAFLDILNKFRKNIKGSNEVYDEVSTLFENHADLLLEFLHFLPGISGTVSAYYMQNRSNDIMNEDGKVSPMAIEWRTQVEKNLRNLEQSKHAEKNDWEEDDSIGHKRKARRDDSATDHICREMKNIEISFRGKMKDRLQDPEVAEKFSDCIRAFRSMFFTADEFRNLIYSLLGAHSDVLEACEDFLSYFETNGSLRNNRQVFRNLKIDGNRDDDDDSKDREKNKVHNIRERDRHDRGLSSNAKDVLELRIPCASKEKFFAKPIHELDLSNCDNCTPSYRQLPENYPIPSARGRTEIGNQVLNDRWVSVTSGSEDYSFKHMRKNQYEESLFRCEDDRFELDMLLESVKSTAKRVEELIYSMNARAIMTESSFCIEDHLTALNLRCIERLYGDHGLDVMDLLRKNAPVALPVILTRLKQKQGEWERCRVDFNKVWAEIYAKNYHKSLDHRSFYFKQQDTKNLTTKGMLAYIENLVLNARTEDEQLLSVYSGHPLPVRTHMEVKYIDPDVHEDVLQIIKVCAEICTPEQSDQILEIWSTFIEPMLGIPSRDILCNAPQSIEGEKNIDDGNASDTMGNGQASSGCGTEAMPNQESEGGGVAANLTSLAIGMVPKEVKVPDSIRLTVKPLNVKVPMELEDKDRTSRVFYGNNSFYFLFRLHQLLYERMLSAKLASENRWNVSNDANPTDLYAKFKDALCSLLNGSIGNAKFEDECRAILGSQSFTLFTLDKLIQKLVKQLQRIVTEPLDTNLLKLFDYERSRSSKTFTDATYRVNARFLLQRENMYRIEFFPSPTRMTIQLIEYDGEYDEFDPLSVSNHPYLAAYLNDELLCVRPGKKKQPAVFLKRNKKPYTTGDEDADFCKAMDGVVMHNGVTMRFGSETNKVAYVLDTEDFIFRPKKMRRVLNGSVPPNVRLQRAKQRKALMLGELGGENNEQPQLDPEVD